MGHGRETGRIGARSSAPPRPTTGTFRRLTVGPAPVRPVRIGFVLRPALPLPVVVGIETIALAEVPLTPGPEELLDGAVPFAVGDKPIFNALVLDARGNARLVIDILRQAAHTAQEPTPPRGRQAPIFVLGRLGHGALGELARIADVRTYDVDGPIEPQLASLSESVAIAARRHAEDDEHSLEAWARGPLSDWIGETYPEMTAKHRAVLAVAALGHARRDITRVLGITEFQFDHADRYIKRIADKSMLPAIAAPFQRALGLETPEPMPEPVAIDPSNRITPRRGMHGSTDP